MGQPINLSKTEFFMIKHFMENQGKVLSRSDLIDAIWGKDYYIDENTIDVYVGYLRSKFAAVTKQEVQSPLAVLQRQNCTFGFIGCMS